MYRIQCDVCTGFIEGEYFAVVIGSLHPVKMINVDVCENDIAAYLRMNVSTKIRAAYETVNIRRCKVPVT